MDWLRLIDKVLNKAEKNNEVGDNCHQMEDDRQTDGWMNRTMYLLIVAGCNKIISCSVVFKINALNTCAKATSVSPAVQSASEVSAKNIHNTEYVKSYIDVLNLNKK